MRQSRAGRVRRAASALALAALVAAFAGAGTAAARTDSIFVKVKPGTDVHALAKRHGMRVRRYLRPIHWLELAPRHGAGAAASAAVGPRVLARRAGVDPAVEAVDPVDSGGKVHWDYVPQDPIFQPTAFLEDGDQAAWHFAKTNFPAAWQQSFGYGVNVAVIDSEFDTTNPDLNPKLVLRYDAASGTLNYKSTNVGYEPGDVFHGSHTAGLVGAKTDNGKGVAGACFECGVIAIKIGSKSSGTFVNASIVGDIAEGLIYASDHGARVISMSLGEPRPDPALAAAVNYAYARGAVIVASAGNSELSKPGEVSYPAAFPNVIGVGATDSSDTIAPFSTEASYVDLVAPGVDVLSTWNSAAPGAEEFFGDGVTTAVESGTSMSAPIVAGLAALMLSVRPDLYPIEVEGLMKLTARDLGITGPDPVYGWGRIDAGAAVAAALSYVRPVPPPAPAPEPEPAPAPAPAPKKQKKVRKLDSRVTLKVKRHKGKLIYFGKVGSARKCRARRSVLLLGKHLHRPLARTGTDPRGFFHLTLRQPPQRRIRVKVKARKVNTRLVCKSAKSRYLGG